jgi:hypothetical protein
MREKAGTIFNRVNKMNVPAGTHVNVDKTSVILKPRPNMNEHAAVGVFGKRPSPHGAKQWSDAKEK